MSKNTKENLKNMKSDELKKKLAELREKIGVIRFKAEGSKSKNVKESASLRKQVAKILTFMNERKQNAKQK